MGGDGFPINLFLDANVYLSIYQYSGEDLTELEKLLAHIDDKSVVLYLTDQVRYECRRRRPDVFNKAIAQLEKNVASEKVPIMCQQYGPECEALAKAANDFMRARGVLLGKLREDSQNRTLKADLLIRKLFDKSKVLEADEEVFKAARIRRDRGNPPGKASHLGDEINWETLLRHAPTSLHIVSADGDFRDEGRDGLSGFLAMEWNEKKSDFPKLYKSLPRFFDAVIPSIKLAREELKNAAIKELAEAPNFRAAKWAAEKLERIAEFSDDQLLEILKACVNNNQVHWISEDDEIVSMVTKVLVPNLPRLDPQWVASFSDLFERDEEDPADSGPEG